MVIIIIIIIILIIMIAFRNGAKCSIIIILF